MYHFYVFFQKDHQFDLSTFQVHILTTPQLDLSIFINNEVERVEPTKAKKIRLNDKRVLLNLKIKYEFLLMARYLFHYVMSH